MFDDLSGEGSGRSLRGFDLVSLDGYNAGHQSAGEDAAPSGSADGYISETEWIGRKSRIDPKLRAAGWCIARHDPTRPLSATDGVAIEEYPTADGPADYALCVGGRIVGIVEAKRAAISPQGVLAQAELARREGRDYEPASALLERIRQERAAQPQRRAGPRRGRARQARSL